MAKKDEIYLAIKSTFKNPKTGYCWIAAKFGGEWQYMGSDVAELVLACISSKRDQVLCPVHGRVHDAKKRTLLAV